MVQIELPRVGKMSKFFQSFILSMSVLIAGAASAAPITWTLSNVTFDDTGTASGSFTYDAATNTYGNVNITTTTGTVVHGGQYFDLGGTTNPRTATKVGFLPHAPGFIGDGNLNLEFSTPLTAAGGNVGIAVGATSTEATCGRTGCSVTNPPSRAVSGGSVVAVAVAAAPVPSLNEWAFIVLAMMMGATGLWILRRSHDL